MLLTNFERLLKKWKYGCKRYKNLPEDEKQKLVEYRENIITMRKGPYYNYKKLTIKTMT